MLAGRASDVGLPAGQFSTLVSMKKSDDLSMDDLLIFPLVPSAGLSRQSSREMSQHLQHGLNDLMQIVDHCFQPLYH